MALLLLPIICVAFIGMVSPHPLLGTACPAVYGGVAVDVSHAARISTNIASDTVHSIVMCDIISKAVGVGNITPSSVATTAASLALFSLSAAFCHLGMWSILHSLGAGSVSDSLHNSVVSHYTSHRMSPLCCMLGTGALTSPSVVGLVSPRTSTWQCDSRTISLLLVALMSFLATSPRVWKHIAAQYQSQDASGASAAHLLHTPRFSITGAHRVILAFFRYSAVGQTTVLSCGKWHCDNSSDVSAAHHRSMR